ncbi:unnamed protein product [Rhodiola kirilowii]
MKRKASTREEEHMSTRREEEGIHEGCRKHPRAMWDEEEEKKKRRNKIGGSETRTQGGHPYPVRPVLCPALPCPRTLPTKSKWIDDVIIDTVTSSLPYPNHTLQRWLTRTKPARDRSLSHIKFISDFNFEPKDQPIDMESDLIQVTRDTNGIGYVTINRPKSLNSLTKAMMEDMAKAFKSLDADQSVKVIILSGNGRSFCSGVDLTAAEDVFKGNVKDAEKDPVIQMEKCRKPIIGAIAGFAVTAGFEIALACDLLIAAKGAKFMDTHARFGIFPSWGLSQKLSRIIGPNKAREVSLTAMPLTAELAEKHGFVNHVVEVSELMSKAREVALAIIKNNQDLVLRYKAVINDGLKLDLGQALALEKERAHDYYDNMTKDQFKKMQEFIADRSSKTQSKL